MLRGERRVDAGSSRICRNFNLVSDRTGLKFSEYLPYLVNRVGWLLVTDFGQNTLARHQLSIAMWRVLAVLANDDGQRQIDVAARTSIDVSTLSRVVTRLVKMGLVTRTRSATNSREVVVRLTPKGAAVLARVIPHAVALERTAMAGVPAKDLGVVGRGLGRSLAPSALRRASSALTRLPRRGCRRPRNSDDFVARPQP